MIQLCAGGCGSSVSRPYEWCARCMRGMTEDMSRLQNLEPGQIVLLADIFSTIGADTLTRIMVNSLPFDDARPTKAELDRLTDE